MVSLICFIAIKIRIIAETKYHAGKAFCLSVNKRAMEDASLVSVFDPHSALRFQRNRLRFTIPNLMSL